MLPFQEYSTSPQVSTRRQTVLVADDDAKDLNFITLLLQRMGYSVEAFGSHSEAESRLENGYFDLVILSQNSRALEARLLTRFALGRNRFTPVVVLARVLEIEFYIEAMQLGAADYVEKPLSPVELQRLVAKYCKPQEDDLSSLDS